MDQRKRPQTAGESASLGGHSPLKPGQSPADSVGEDRKAVISPGNREQSDDYRQQQANAEQGTGDSTEGSREFIAGSGKGGRAKPGSGSSRKTGAGSYHDQGTSSATTDIESGQLANRQDAALDDNR